MLLGTANRDISCLIFKHIENKKIRIELVSPITNITYSQLAVGFIDDISFFTSRNIALENMQQILITYLSLHQVIGGKVYF